MTEARRTRPRPRGAGVPPPAALLCAALAGAPAAEATLTIFLNDCQPVTCTVVGAGFDDSRTNRSSIVSGTRSLAAFDLGDEIWQQVVACVTEVWRPFDVTIVTVDPSPASHLEHMLAGHPSDLGFSDGTGGVAPFTCGLVPNSISFTFSEIWGANVLDLCWTASMEIAHSLGLDHELYRPDPMTYLGGCGRKDFAAVAAPCGEFSARVCFCGGTTQNSYALLAERAGASDFVFEGSFEDFEVDWICDWSGQEPPPAGALGPEDATGIDPTRPRCGTFDPEVLERSGFRAGR